MPAYSPPEQILFSPVSNFYQGKAIRQQLAAGEQDKELKGLQIDLAKQEVADAPAKRKAALEMLELDRKKAILDVEKGISDLGFTRMKRRADAMRPVVEEAEKMFKAGDQEGAANYLTKSLPAALQDIDPEAASQIEEMSGPDHIWQPEEMMRLRNRVEAFGKIEEDKDKGLDVKTHINYLMPDGSVVAARPDSPEADKIVANGGVVAGSKSLAGGYKPTDRDKKLVQYEEILGLSSADAIKLADNIYSVRPNPVTGAVQVIDETPGNEGNIVKEVQVERDDVPRPSPKPGHTLWELITYATGPINTFAATISVPLAWAGATPAKRIIDARQVFKTTNQDFIRALVNNKRYPIGEVNRVVEEMNLVPSFMDDPKLMRIRMGALRDSLQLRADQADADARNPNNPSAFRGGAKQAAADINNYLAILGEPTAPKAALEMLKQNPELIDAFEDKFGYRPEGY